MRARTLGGLAAALTVLIAPAAVSAQTVSSLVANNPDVHCDLPLPAAMVTGELGSTLWVQDPADIDKVTVTAAPGAVILDVQWTANRREAIIDVSSDVEAYTVWSCAPLNGEPVMANDPQQV